ncbi:PfkB family carbohydrate kinase [Desulfobulbus sp.]|uniref:PfkB family carbohydrate kinase n=1 Tax=Desulfobulbus sp. TaxID=895 RepID=UPI00286F75D8|nr:PfkB family carbohydrate kinase [Desulfobulbus sp.]
MQKGVFLGLSTADIVYYVPHYLQRNQKLKAERQLAYAGGPAANSAVTFASFGNEATLISGLGQHPLADLAKADLADHKVRLIDSTDQPRRPPILSAIIVDLSNGERSVVYSNTDLRKLRRDCVNETTLEYADILMLDGFYLPQAMELAAMAKPKRIPVILDGGSWKEGLENLLPLVDYAICSAAFFPPGCTTPDSVFAYLRGHGIEHMAITRDGDPVLAQTGGQLREVPVMPVKVMDTLGAGDIFHGAFCHYILENDFILSLERAGEVASLSCASLGTRAWIEQEKFI